MKYKFLFIILIISFFPAALFSREVKEFSYFTMMGEIELRKNPDFSEPPQDITLNHEGGMKVRVIEIGKKETHDGKTGVWLKVITTAPMWVASGEWIEKYARYWFFLEDDAEIFNYEE